MKAHALHHNTILNKPRKEVFRFFSVPGNLGLITPPSFSMEMTGISTSSIQQGTIIDYKIKVSGIPLKWRTAITVWEPPCRFIDVQLEGPYRLWIHEHVFEEEENRTIMHDHLRYLSPGWIFEPLINKWYVKRQLEQLFDYRTERLNEIFKGT